MKDDDMLKAAIAYKHDNFLTNEQREHLTARILPLDDLATLNAFIINTFSYMTGDLQFTHMTEFFVSTVEELTADRTGARERWNVAESRSLIDLSVVHIFNKVVTRLDAEGFIHAHRYAKGVITEAYLAKSKELVIFRLEGS